MRLEKEVKVEISKGKELSVFGRLGKIECKLGGNDVKQYKEGLFFKSKASYNSFKSLVKRMDEGVSYGYFINLMFKGLGYRVLNFKERLIFKLGYSHYIELKKKNGLYFLGYKNNLLVLGLSLKEVKQMGEIVKNFKKVDVYKGKGIFFLGDEIVTKIGKKR